MELNELRKTAEAATPGPWKEDVDQRGDCVVWGPNGRFLLNAQAEPHWLEYPGETRSVAFDVDRRDCTHIATFDPETVLALLSRLEQAEQAVARVREKHAERVLVYPNGAEEHYCSAEENSAWPCDTIRALDGDGRG